MLWSRFRSPIESILTYPSRRKMQHAVSMHTLGLMDGLIGYVRIRRLGHGQGSEKRGRDAASARKK